MNSYLAWCGFIGNVRRKQHYCWLSLGSLGKLYLVRFVWPWNLMSIILNWSSPFGKNNGNTFWGIDTAPQIVQFYSTLYKASYGDRRVAPFFLPGWLLVAPQWCPIGSIHSGSLWLHSCGYGWWFTVVILVVGGFTAWYGVVVGVGRWGATTVA